MDKAKQWVALAVAASLALLAGGWFLLVQPQRAEAALLEEQTAAQVEQNAQLSTQLEVLRAKAAGLPDQERVLAEIAAQIPADPQLPALLRALTAAGRAAGVELTAVTPGSAQALAPDGAGATAEQVAGTGLTTIPLTMRVSGDFYELEQFVAGLEDLPRALRVTTLTVDDAQDTGGRKLNTTVTAAVYVSAGAPAAAAPAAASAGGTDPAAPAASGADPAAPAASGADPAAPAASGTDPATADAGAPAS